jgi:ABC-type multidrug transport system ATPase subunit
MVKKDFAAGSGDASGRGDQRRVVIEVAHLRKTYGKTVAVDDVSFSVQEDGILGILGPNGAGKTTTVECIVGLRSPDAGTIRVLGLDPQRVGLIRFDGHLILWG